MLSNICQVDGAEVKGGGDDDETACFSAGSKVTLESGATKTMVEVNVGDRILTVTADGSMVYADVVFLPHS